VAKLDPKKAKERFEEYLNEIENLKGVPDEGGGDELRNGLDEKIRSLINLAFDDAKEKLARYNVNPYFGLSTNMSEGERRNAHQSYHESRLRLMKQYVVGYCEELSLIMDTDTKTEELSEIEAKIKKSALETDRREEVAKSKFFGAVIEMLDFQRNELKRRSETDKEISEIKNSIIRLEENIAHISIERATNTQSENMEDVWIKEIIKNQEASYSPYSSSRITDAKKVYSKIKILRKQVSEMEGDLPMIGSQVARDFSYQQIKNRRTDLNNELEKLSQMWSNYS